ncbi:MAG: SDR family NAD(P)-dependent oxidoreductase [Antricoccus sp.]
MSWTAADLLDLTGQTFVVTGATNGIGLDTATALSKAGAEVVLAVRNVELGKQRAAQLRGPTRVHHLDLANLQSVRAFADELDGNVDVLINNAGIFSTKAQFTIDGFELMMGTNFLGPFALTNLLWPRITSRVTVVGSLAHRSGQVNLDDPYFTGRKWTPARSYAQSKLADMLWALELERRLRQADSAITATIAHPGWAGTKLGSGNGFDPMLSVVQGIARVVANSSAQGAASVLYAATMPLPSGSYIGPGGLREMRGAPTQVKRAERAADSDLARRLWEWASEQTGTDLSST